VIEGSAESHKNEPFNTAQVQRYSALFADRRNLEALAFVRNGNCPELERICSRQSASADGS
jgi:hypothetical protein